MISKNPLKTKVLITVDEVVFHAPVDNQADYRTILQSIIIAERRFIKPILGSTVYQKLIDAKNTLVTSGNIVSLQAEIDEETHEDREQQTLVEGDLVNSDSLLDATQAALWHNCLHKIVAEAVWFCALPVNRSRFTAAGVIKNHPETISESQTSVTVDLRDLKHLMDRGLQDRISPLIDDMHSYMCISRYPDYSRNCGCDGRGTPKKTDLILGMYEDDEPCGCRRKRSEDEYY